MALKQPHLIRVPFNFKKCDYTNIENNPNEPQQESSVTSNFQAFSIATHNDF